MKQKICYQFILQFYNFKNENMPEVGQIWTVRWADRNGLGYNVAS